MSDVLHLEREGGGSAGGFRDLFEYPVAAQKQAAVVGGDGVDDDFGALRHLDGLRARDFALIILAVAHDHDRLAHGTVRTILQKLFPGGAVDGVVQRRSASILQLVYARREQFHVVGEILRHLALGVEADYEGFVEAGADCVLQEVYGGVLLEIKTAVDRSAHVDKQAEVQRQISFAPKINNRLRRLVDIEHREGGLIQVADKLPILVGGDEQKVNLLGPFVN